MKKPISIIIGVIVLIVIVWFFLTFRTGHNQESSDQVYTIPGSVSTKQARTYTDSDLSFSFTYPNDFTAKASGQPSSRLVLVSSSVDGQEFQLYVIPFGDAPSSVTPERIKSDVPGIDMRNAKMITVAGGGQGVSFLSTVDGVDGDVRDVWFALNGHLFQWSAPVGSEATMQAAISTLKL